ncbi:hypothetical protein B0J18DRAFT_361280 [Chaetomium sp. MPI-SDFR-AT-0129]|nr:hypothetical protein B0J18DRAFT_361280 [Chaetomium sp. MPI-SDFR-AT-0129]
MSSTYSSYPPGPNTTRRDQLEQPRSIPSQDPSQFLNPLSPQLGSNLSSPGLNAHTPADSVSTISVHYQSSEFSEPEDPFFGAIDFSNFVDTASPSFLNDENVPFDGNGPQPTDNLGAHAVPPNAQQHVQFTASYLPLSPDKSPPMPGVSSNEQFKDEAPSPRGGFPDFPRAVVVPQDLSLAHTSSAVFDVKQPGFELTPQTSHGTESSDDGGVAPTAAMKSPQVTVSHWDSDYIGAFDAQGTQDHHNSSTSLSTARGPDGQGGGWAPDARSSQEVDSVNNQAAQRDLEERNQEVAAWRNRSASVSLPLSRDTDHPDEHPVAAPDDGDDNISPREISGGERTENKFVPGRTYYTETGGAPTADDLEIMRQGHVWQDAPTPFSISKPSSRHQPGSSADAMAKYQQMCRDTDSVVSRTATWGTRRTSWPGAIDAEVAVTGNLFKRLALNNNKGDPRRPSIFGEVRSRVVRKLSVNGGKRKTHDSDDASSFMTQSSTEKAQGRLAPPSPSLGWAKKQSVPTINTAFADVGSKFASIASSHARAGSVSATPITSPKSPAGLGLMVRNTLGRSRSKSETGSSLTTIATLWRKTGGPPVPNTKASNATPNLTPNANAMEGDGDEEEEDDQYEDNDMKGESDKLIDGITPDIKGFKQHILKLNPLLSQNPVLTERLAYLQSMRYKQLLNHRVKHLQAVAAKNCACGSRCIALGGNASALNAKGGQRAVDPHSAGYDGSDGDITPLEGAITQQSFPQDIPMPPTASLPSEFECQLCFTTKKFQKPSDWTKHVHEDVAPFACTWTPCKEVKPFKRKADWVRHENEGHRQLEWWVCDVEDCTHQCYRRDNFLQHLVREHKFVEPKVKTKAAIKLNGGHDATWAKVEQCHQETPKQPQDEPCRFCGKTFPSWKKLTVHLAKHMEHISLPVLRLVAKAELDEDTIISPVHDPPPRHFPPAFVTSPDQPRSGVAGTAFGPSPTLAHGPMAYSAQPPPLGMYPHPMGLPTAPQPYANLYNPVGFDNLAHDFVPPQLQMNISPLGAHHPQFSSINNPSAPAVSTFSAGGLPVTSPAGPYMSAAPLPPARPSASVSPAPDLEPFPSLDMDALGLGLPNPGPDAAVIGGQMGYGVGGNAPQHQIPGHHQHQGHPQLGHPQQHYSPQGSVSPYGRSPNAPQGPFY